MKIDSTDKTTYKPTAPERQPKETKPESKPPLRSKAGKLTRRLVMATGQFEVRQILTEASKELLSMRVAAATYEGSEAATALAIVRNLERLIDRGVRKIHDLNEEDELRARKAREELKEKEQKRMTRERRYLLDADKHSPKSVDAPPIIAPAAAPTATTAEITPSLNIEADQRLNW